MGGGGSKIEETEQERALARVSMQQWNNYLSTYKPFEDDYMDNVDRLNTDEQYNQAASLAALPVEAAYSEAVNDTVSGLNSRAINPNSGVAKSAMTALDTSKRSAKADNITRAQVGQQSRYLGEMGNVVAMGQGQATTAVNGMGDLASLSSREAYNDTNIALNNRQQNRELAGAVAGAGTRYGLELNPSGSGK